MTHQQLSRLAVAALTATVLGTSASAFAYGAAAPMGVTGVEALAPVTSLRATAAIPTELQQPAPPTSLLRAWIAALRLRIDGALDVAQR